VPAGGWFFYEFLAQYRMAPASRARYAILNRAEAEANHDDPHQRLAVSCRVGRRNGGRVAAQADAVSGPRPPVLLPALTGYRIQLKYRRLHKDAHIFGLRDHPGDTSCEKVPPDASPNLVPTLQPIEK
jgi:hypothetical protein